jgi:DNA primase
METLDVLDAVFEYLEGAIRYEHYIYALCPFHDDHRPSFAVYPNSYYCRSCGAKGSTSQLVSDIQHKRGTLIQHQRTMNFRNPFNMWIRSYGSIEQAMQRAQKRLQHENKTAYITNIRGINSKTIEHLMIGWLDDWVTFPIRDQIGDIIGAVARAGATNTSIAKYVIPKDQDPNMLYVPDWDMIQSHSPVYLVFGIIDAVTLHQLGLASISTTTGKRLDHTALDFLRSNIVIVPDAGEEIDAAMLSAQLGWRGKAKRIKWPEGCKDVNDVYRYVGSSELLALLGA